jgi:hypothetical protein
MVRPSAALSLQLPEPNPGWQAWEISWVLSQRNPLANGIDLFLLKGVSPIEWNNILLQIQYNLDRKLVRRRRAP